MEENAELRGGSPARSLGSVCPRCEGSGKYQRLPGNAVTDCAVCEGTGKIIEQASPARRHDYHPEYVEAVEKIGRLEAARSVEGDALALEIAEKIVARLRNIGKPSFRFLAVRPFPAPCPRNR